MKPINTLLALLFISLLSSPSWGETMDDLVERNGLYYQKFTDVPFTGEITGPIAVDNWSEQGSVKNGKREGAWVSNYSDWQIASKGNYKNGKQSVSYVIY